MEAEFISTFTTELRRHLASKCEFGNFLEDALRDKFVAGLKNPAIQAALLEKEALTFETTCEVYTNHRTRREGIEGFKETSRGEKACMQSAKMAGRSTNKVIAPSSSVSNAACNRCSAKYDAGNCQ